MNKHYIKYMQTIKDNTQKYRRQHPDVTRKTYEKNKVVILARAKERNKMYKNIVFSSYGNKCYCCGETNPIFLSIDHVNGGGNAHKRSIKKHGVVYYQWIITNKFPDYLRLLCYNCNMGRQINNGVCPHSLEN